MENSMNYFEQKETIAKFKKVMVMGPHGAGNKIMSLIIAQDFGLQHIWSDKPWNTDDYYSERLGLKYYLERLNEEDENYVSFCPSFTAHLHRISEYLQDVLVVMMHKDLDEIDDYINRNEFLKKETMVYESTRYNDIITEDFPEDADKLLSMSLEELTYEFFENYQKEYVPNVIHVHHSSLEQHPLFIPKEKRKNFNCWQTTIEE
jgi:hypothetical protein